MLAPIKRRFAASCNHLMTRPSVIVAGAGIIGASIAFNLARKGYPVTLLDRTAPAAGASFGNAGGIVNNSCVPTSTPGIVFDVARMLTQPHSPFSLRPRYFLKALPWLIQFLNQSRRIRVDHNADRLHALTSSAASDWLKLVGETTLNRYVKNVGWLKVFSSTNSFANMIFAQQLMDRLQVPYEVLGASDIRQLEPALAPEFSHGLFQSDALHITDPGALVHEMTELLLAHGGTYQKMSVEQINTSNDTVTVSSGSTSLTADKLIIATGAYSKTLATMVGDKVMLAAERGYHMMFPRTTATLLSRPVVNGDDSFVLSPMETGMRMTSQVEIADVEDPPDYQRIRGLSQLAKRMLPELDIQEESVWMGCRPSLPDSLPVIGPSSVSNNIIYAFGHQHLGMTLGPVTAFLVEQILAGVRAKIDLHPYRIDRFNTAF